jgi:PAS domain S-box-containing protein
LDRTQQQDSEDRRLALLRAYPLDRAGLSDQLNQLASVAAKLCDAPIGLVSIVDADRQFFIGRSGIDVTETPREVSFCSHAMLGTSAMVVPDATSDPRFSANPLVTGDPSIRFYAGVPLKSSEGMPLGSFCIIDTVPREALTAAQLDGLNALANAAMAHMELCRSEAEISARDEIRRKAILERDRRFQLLADSMPQLMWSANSKGMVDYYNQGWCDYTGLPPEQTYGNGWLDIVHEDDRSTAQAHWQAAVATGEAYEIEYRLRGASGEDRWMLARGVPITDRRGRITRWFGTCTDIHEQKRTTDLLQILSRELNHRIKNIFAVIGGLVSLTTRHHPGFEGAGSELQQRILALGRAHDFVRGTTHGGTKHSDLVGMLRVILTPYQNHQGERVRISGPQIEIDDRSATPLALFVHELATNAAKYGALSVPEGVISLTVEHGDNILIRWQEQNGPAVTPSTEEGFGARLIEMSIVRQLGGTVEYDWRQDGLEVQAEIPASAMRR